MKPGIYPNMPFAEYKAIQALNHSILKEMDKSPAHVAEAMRTPREATKAMNLGSGLHAWILERDRFEDIVAIEPAWTSDGRTKEGKAARQDFAATAGDRLVISADDFEKIKRMGKAIGTHADARNLALTKGQTECSIVWEDAETGILCKGRIDKWLPDYGIGVDLKTTKSAEWDDFARSLIDYSYHTQFEFYRMGLAALNIECKDFNVIAIESEPPHCVQVFDIDESTRNIGFILVRQWINQYSACVALDSWPGYSTKKTTIGAPDWYLRRYQNNA